MESHVKVILIPPSVKFLICTVFSPFWLLQPNGQQTSSIHHLNPPFPGHSPIDIPSLIWTPRPAIFPPPTSLTSHIHSRLSSHPPPRRPKLSALSWPLSCPHQLFLWPFWEASLLSLRAVGLLSLCRLTALQWLFTLLRCVLPVTVAQSNGPPARQICAAALWAAGPRRQLNPAPLTLDTACVYLKGGYCDVWRIVDGVWGGWRT